MLKLPESAVSGQAREPIDLNEVAERLKQGLAALAIRSVAAGARATMTEPVVEAGDVERWEAEAERKLAAEAAVRVKENTVRMIEATQRARQMQEDLHIVAEAERKRAADAVAVVSPSPENVKPSVEMEEWRRVAFPLERLLGGVAALKEAKDMSFAELDVSEARTLPFSIPMMLAAVEACHGTLKIPVKDEESRRKWIKAIYPSVTFNDKRVPNKGHMQGLLNRAYLEGKLRHEDGELDLDLASHLRRVA